MKKFCLLFLSLALTTASPKPPSPIADDTATLLTHLSEDTQRVIKDLYNQQYAHHKRWLSEHRDDVIGPNTTADDDNTTGFTDRKLRETLWITSLIACEAAAFKVLTDEDWGCNWNKKYAIGLLAADWFLMPLLFDIYPITTIPAVLVARIVSKIRRSAPGWKERVAEMFRSPLKQKPSKSETAS